MFSVQEVKEETDVLNIKSIGAQITKGLFLNSPRIYMTDNAEDSLSPKPVYLTSTSFHVNKNYSLVEDDEIITEEKEENALDNPDKIIKKKESLHKLINNIYDREEDSNIIMPNKELNVVNEGNFEPIKEECEGEEDIIQHKIHEGYFYLFNFSYSCC